MYLSANSNPPILSHAHHKSNQLSTRLALRPEDLEIELFEAWILAKGKGISIQLGGSGQVWPMSHE